MDNNISTIYFNSIEERLVNQLILVRTQRELMKDLLISHEEAKNMVSNTLGDMTKSVYEMRQDFNQLNMTAFQAKYPCFINKKI